MSLQQRSRKPINSRLRNSLRTSRRTGRLSLLESIENANNRAITRSNRRLGERQNLTSVHAAIAEYADDDFIHLNIPQRILRWVFALMLLPFCFVTTMALFNVTDSASGASSTFWIDLIKTPDFLYFSVGMFLMGGWFFTGVLQRKFLYLYVLGHELTHAIFVYICGGRVSGINVTADGGYIMTNKSNILIALAPYFVPFWSVVVLILSTTIALFYPIPHQDKALYFLVGGSWAFHLLWTMWMIPRDQPDLKENGTFFSLVIIYLANVILLSVLLCAAPGNLTWHHWANQFADAAASMKDLIIHNQLLRSFIL